jgi:glycosyltransferase involved in cell wall biosynthesis
MILKPKIAVIMPSYLGDYDGSASNRKFKFIRAINSFLGQSYRNKILIIVSDGCPKTNKIYNNECRNHNNIHLVKLEKQPLFSGNVRQSGIDFAILKKANIITYLDTDDVISLFHLEKIYRQMKDYDWIAYPDFLAIDPSKNIIGLRQIKYQFGSIGTSNISHRIIEGAEWTGCDGWGHDWTFIQKLMALTTNYDVTEPCEYFVHHLKGKFDN